MEPEKEQKDARKTGHIKPNVLLIESLSLIFSMNSLYTLIFIKDEYTYIHNSRAPRPYENIT